MGNVHMEASQINYRGGETKMSVEEALKNTSGEAAAIAALQTAVGNLQSGKANLSVIAPAFSADTAYAVGDIVAYEGVTYRCTTAHEGAWDADDFAATTIDAELKSLNSKFNGVARGLELTGQSFTIGNDGNVILDLPSALVGKTLLVISCSYFETTVKPPYGWAVLYNSNKYILYGEANDAYTNATVDFVYM